ncbi:hypothetical protein [Sphaerisporangium fuscum]|uniref:hypothetical protein n=1 Tax=Sphaerisporangium fuscum TaxID=2835868 RepID=UPI002029B00C|nr:hypothetical protein [Sphaerisporangium fuscum]
MRFLTVGALFAAAMATVVPATAATTAHTTRVQHAAHAEHGMHADSVRYASLKSCKDKHGDNVACGPWQLYLHSGKKKTLRDARVFPHDAKGKVMKDLPSPTAVSGDGEYIAYLRQRDDRLVVRELTGKVHVMPATAIPRHTSTADLSFNLSLKGAVLAVASGDQGWLRLFDVASGKQLGTVRKHGSFVGFSGDEDEVLTTRDTNENTTELVTYDLEGHQVKRQEPPQVVAQQNPLALNADGSSVALYSSGSHTLKVYDLDSQTIVSSVKVRFPGDDAPEMIDWTGDHEVTVHAPTGNGSTVHMRIFQIDPRTGAKKLRDSYRIKNAFSYAACGG